MSELIPLHCMSDGDVGVVEQLRGQEGEVRRLQELGFVAGVEIKMVRSGVPCILQLHEQRLCFRYDGSTMVLVSLRERLCHG